jgi:hypothetical protein
MERFSKGGGPIGVYTAAQQHDSSPFKCSQTMQARCIGEPLRFVPLAAWKRLFARVRGVAPIRIALRTT